MSEFEVPKYDFSYSRGQIARCTVLEEYDTLKQLLQNLDENEKKSDTACSLLKFANCTNRDQAVQLFHEIGVGFVPDHHAAIDAFILSGGLEQIKSTEVFIERGFDIKLVSEIGENVLSFAVKSAPLEKIQWLINEGADACHTNLNGDTLILVASVKERSIDVLKVLAKAGANPLIFNRVNSNAFIIEMSQNHYEKAQEILDICNDLDITNKHGETTLMRVMLYGKSEYVRMLLDAGANPDLQNPDGETALMIAVKRNDFKSVCILINAGADIFIADKKASPLKSARNPAIRALLQYLETTMEESQIPPCSAIHHFVIPMQVAEDIYKQGNEDLYDLPPREEITKRRKTQ